MDFTHKRVLVTGASRGIGAAVARQFARAGARVAVHYRVRRATAEHVAAGLPGGPHTTIAGDVADPTAVERLVATAVAELGGLDIVVNNAGIFVDHPLADVDYATWQAAWADILAVNLTGAANVCYCAARHMIVAGRGGRIVNISSRGAFRGEPLAPAYGASKAGLNALSQSLARYLAPHRIFVGVVAPGFVETDMAADHLAGPPGDAIRAQSPLNRVATPDEVAHAALFLASPGAEFTTGAIIDVNGASYLRT